MPGFLRNQKIRNILLQALFVAVVLIIVVGGWRNAKATLEAQHIVSGFGFLEKATGWDVNFSLLPHSASDPYWWFFVIGIVNTLFLGTLGLALATLIGGTIGIMRTVSHPVLNLLGRTYVDVFRNIPLILQVFFWYALVTHLPAPRNAISFGPLTLSSRGIYMPVLNVGGWYQAAAGVALLLALVLPLCLARTRRIARPPEARRPLVLGGPGGRHPDRACPAAAGPQPGGTADQRAGPAGAEHSRRVARLARVQRHADRHRHLWRGLYLGDRARWLQIRG